MTITPEQLKTQAKKLFLTRWTYSHCESCDYARHFRFDASGVLHDVGCTCIDVETIRQKYMPSTYQEVVEVFVNLSKEDAILAFKFWKLNPIDYEQQEQGKERDSI